MMVDLPDVPVQLRCTRCYEERAVTMTMVPGDDTYPEYTLDPPCPGYYDTDDDDDTIFEILPVTEDTDTVQRVWCPFDGQDDYQHTGDEDKVWVARRYARDVLEARSAD